MAKDSWVLIWTVWIHKRKERWRFCSDCQEIIYGCEGREKLSHQDYEYLIRDFCQSCDSFPFCDKVEYLRKSKVGDPYFGDLAVYHDRWEENP